MVTLEQVEKLCERADITYEEARKVLEETNGDMLEAVILLENQGRIKKPSGGGYYNSKNDQQIISNVQKSNNNKTDYHDEGESFSKLMGRFFRWCCKVIHKGNVNTFEVRKDDSKVMVIPITVLIVLLLFAFWVTIPVIIIGLFFGYRFRFSGPDIDNSNVNSVMDSVADAADNLKKDVKGSGNADSDNNAKNDESNSAN